MSGYKSGSNYKEQGGNIWNINGQLKFKGADIGAFVAGNVFYVDSGNSNASDSNAGTDMNYPLATLNGAIDKCTANNGDRIIIAPGHSESWTTTGAKAVFDTAGIEVIGLGSGSDRPTFSFGHTGATWTISAANITLSNLLFVTAVDSVVTFATISGADCKLLNCETRDAAAKEVIDAFTCTTGATRLLVDGHTHIGDVSTGDASESIFNLTDADNWTIKNSKFITLCGTGVIEIASTAENAVVENCVFYVAGTSDLSLNIVDTDDDSTIVVKDCFDLAAMYKFSGGNAGSGFSVAGDDVGAVGAAVAVVDTVVDAIKAVTDNLPDSGALSDLALLLDNRNVLKVTIADGTGIPNNSQAAGGLLATATGDVMIEEITIQRGATNFVGPSNYEFTTDNAAGLTGVDAPQGVLPLADFNANKTTVLSLDGSTKQLPFVLEDTKKLYIHGDDAATSAGGTTDIYIKFRGIGSSSAKLT